MPIHFPTSQRYGTLVIVMSIGYTRLHSVIYNCVRAQEQPVCLQLTEHFDRCPSFKLRNKFKAGYYDEIVRFIGCLVVGLFTTKQIV